MDVFWNYKCQGGASGLFSHKACRAVKNTSLQANVLCVCAGWRGEWGESMSRVQFKFNLTCFFSFSSIRFFFFFFFLSSTYFKFAPYVPFRELRIKTAARHLPAQLTMALTKHSTHRNSGKGGNARNRTFLPCFQEWKWATATMENAAEVLETLKTELPCDLAIPPVDLQTKENHNLESHLYPKVHCRTVGNASNRKLPGQTPGEEDASICPMGGTREAKTGLPVQMT